MELTQRGSYHLNPRIYPHNLVNIPTHLNPRETRQPAGAGGSIITLIKRDACCVRFSILVHLLFKHSMLGLTHYTIPVRQAQHIYLYPNQESVMMLVPDRLFLIQIPPQKRRDRLVHLSVKSTHSFTS